MAKLLEVKDLCCKFDGLWAVSGVDLTVEEGTVVGLAGPNGAGKTTLFNIISGFISPSSGNIYYEGKEITGWPVSRRVNAGITRTFQGSRVFPGLTVRENVLTGTYSTGDKKTFAAIARKADEGDLFGRGGSSIEWILEVTHLDRYRETMACKLSYGYRQRLELAIALATDPKLLLLDEPFSGTHVSDLRELSGLLKIVRDAGLSVVLVEHDIASVANVADRLVYMESGKVTIPNG